MKRLSADERTRASELYTVLDRIEYFTIAPFLFGMFVMVAGVVLPPYLGVNLSEVNTLLYMFGLYATGVLFLKMFVFNPRRDEKVDELKRMLVSNPNYKGTLETLKRLDPDMARNIRRSLAQIA